jgi:hypothetical protein
MSLPSSKEEPFIGEMMLACGGWLEGGDGDDTVIFTVAFPIPPSSSWTHRVMVWSPEPRDVVVKDVASGPSARMPFMLDTHL